MFVVEGVSKKKFKGFACFVVFVCRVVSHCLKMRKVRLIALAFAELRPSILGRTLHIYKLNGEE